MLNKLHFTGISNNIIFGRISFVSFLLIILKYLLTSENFSINYCIRIKITHVKIFLNDWRTGRKKNE